jgi:hypothetical protein
MGPIKKLQARFYQTSTGRKPVREWLLDIKEKDRRTIGYDIQTVEFGWPVACRRVVRLARASGKFEAI